MPILPIAAQVAGEEPVSAENSAHAPMLLMTSEPGTLCSQRASASYRSLPARETGHRRAHDDEHRQRHQREVAQAREHRLGHEVHAVPAVEDDHEQQRHRTQTEGNGQPVASSAVVTTKISRPMANGLMSHRRCAPSARERRTRRPACSRSARTTAQARVSDHAPSRPAVAGTAAPARPAPTGTESTAARARSTTWSGRCCQASYHQGTAA